MKKAFAISTILILACIVILSMPKTDMMRFFPLSALMRFEKIIEEHDVGIGDSLLLVAYSFNEQTHHELADACREPRWNLLSETNAELLEIVDNCLSQPETWSDYYNNQYTLIKDIVNGTVAANDLANCYWAYSGDYENGERIGTHLFAWVDLDRSIAIYIKNIY